MPEEFKKQSLANTDKYHGPFFNPSTTLEERQKIGCNWWKDNLKLIADLKLTKEKIGVKLNVDFLGICVGF